MAKRRISEIAARFSVDGLTAVQRAMRTAAKGAGDAAKSVVGLANADVGKLGAGASKVASDLDRVAASASGAASAVDKLAGAGVGGLAADAGKAAAGVDGIADAAKGAAVALDRMDFGGLDPRVADRAIRAYKRSLGRGLELDVYVDKKSLVRLERDQLAALERARRTDLSRVDAGAVARAGAAAVAARAAGSSLSSFTDAQTFASFDADQLEAAIKLLDKAEDKAVDVADAVADASDGLADVADEAKVVDKNLDRAADAADNLDTEIAGVEKTAGIGSRALGTMRTTASRTAVTVAAIGTAGLAAGRQLANGMRIATRAIGTATKTAAGLTAGLTAAAAVKVGGAAAFAVNAGNDTVERYKSTRNVAALTGMSPQQVEMWERFGASVGLEGTDLGQVFSGFVAAMRDSKDEASDTGKAFKDLGLSIYDAGNESKGLAGLLPDLQEKKDDEADEKKPSSPEKGDDKEDLKSALEGAWPGIYGGDGKDQPLRKTGDVFMDFLRESNKMSTEARAQLYTQVFGEDDALKVAELADAVRAGQMGEFQTLIASPQELAAIKAYQVSVLKLGNTWAWFKRQMTVALQPLLSAWMKFLEGRIVRNAGAVIDAYFVRPLRRASQAALDFIRYMDGTRGWARVHRAIQATFQTVRDFGRTLAALGKLVFTAFAPKKGVGATYIEILDAISAGLYDVWKWASDARGAKAMQDFLDVLKGVWTLAKALGATLAGLGLAIGDELKRAGIDLGQVFTIDNLRGVFSSAIGWASAFFRDVARLLSGTTQGIETGLVQSGLRVAAAFVVVLGTLSDYVDATIAGIGKSVRSEIDAIVGYVRDAFSQALSGGGGMGMSGVDSLLGKLLYIVVETVGWLERLGQAVHAVFKLGVDEAPAGFQWLVDVREILGGALTAIRNIHNALKPIISVFDGIIERIGGWNTATVLLAGVIAGKLFGALSSVVGVARTLLGVLGFGGAAAGAGAAVGGAAGGAAATTGAAAVGGGIAGAMSRIAAGVATFASRLIAPVGILAGAYAAYKLLEANVDSVLNRIGMGSESVDAAVAKARAQMDADLARYGDKRRLDENLGSRANTAPVFDRSGFGAGAVDRMIRFETGGDRATSTVHLHLDGGEVLTVPTTSSGAAALQRSRALSLGRG